MKKRMMIALTVVFALGLAMAVYALNQNHTIHLTKADCCKKSDSCPMKDKQAKAETKACCDKPECCCNGDSNCPMKGKSEMSSMDNCPMKKSSEQQTPVVSTEMQNVTVADNGENCCNGCDCCQGKKS